MFVVREDKLLLGKRQHVFGAGTWGLPGGHLEMQEAMKDAAARELREETGLEAEDFQFVNLVNDYRREGHHIQVGFFAMGVHGEPRILEPERCAAWEYFPLERLPQDLFVAHQRQIQLFIAGKEHFADG